MKTDALSDLIRTVGDDSPVEHKAMFHLWSALDDVLTLREPIDPRPTALARRGLDLAAGALTRKQGTS